MTSGRIAAPYERPAPSAVAVRDVTDCPYGNLVGDGKA